MFPSYLKLIILSILISNKLSKNIDTDFPIVLSINKSNFNEVIDGSYFGVTLSGFKQNDQVMWVFQFNLVKLIIYYYSEYWLELPSINLSF